MKTLMIAVVACSSMMMTGCGTQEEPEELNNEVTGRNGNENTGDEEENDSVDVNVDFEADGWKDSVNLEF